MKSYPYPLRAVPGLFGSRPGIGIGTSVSYTASDEDLRFLQQVGVDWAMVNFNEPAHHTVENYLGVRERLDAFGIQVYRIANHAVHNVPEITLGLPGRDEKIEELCQFLRNLGKAGIKYHTYAHMGNGIWSTGHVEGRGGVSARSLDIRQARGYWIDKVFEGELTHGRPYTEDEIWDNFEYMIRRVAPVAEEAGVFVGIHPDDPPVYALGGIPRCVFGTFAGYRRAIEMANSPNIGVCLCIGCWLEGGPEGMGGDVIEAIRYFGERRKLFKVHFRNVSNPMPEPWQETFIDDGYQDMHLVMRALREVGFDGAIIPDHIPQMIGGYRPGLAYSIAYMKALVQAVNNEFGGPTD
ncbi:MAG: mannonate dehydratase [Capsulimonadales bacterium]|nr:mannonate dehydratase [Capsulimonadales bacterium]